MRHSSRDGGWGKAGGGSEGGAGPKPDASLRAAPLTFLIPLSLPLLISPDPHARHPHFWDPGVWPPREPDLLCALGLCVGHAPNLVLDTSCPHLPGPEDPPLLSAHPHPTAPGPQHQPHLSGDLAQSRSDHNEDCLPQL